MKFDMGCLLDLGGGDGLAKRVKESKCTKKVYVQKAKTLIHHYEPEIHTRTKLPALLKYLIFSGATEQGGLRAMPPPPPQTHNFWEGGVNLP